MTVSTLLNPLKELFSIQNDEVAFDQDNPYSSWKAKASMGDFTKTHTLQGNVVYSVADIQWNTEVKEVFLKMKNKIRDEEVDKFIQHISSEINLLIQELQIDYIVQVPSSSAFLRTIVQRMSADFKIPSASFLSIAKTPIGELKFNKRSPYLDGMDRYEVAEVKDQVMKHIRYQIEDNNEYLEAKRFPKHLLGFITGFFKVSGDTSSLRGKRVLIIDDNLSSGNTMKDIVDMFSVQFQCEASGLVMFKVVA